MPHFIRIGSLFFANAFLIGTWLTRVPDFLTALQIDKATIGLALFAAPFGTLATLPFVGRWIERTSPGRVALVSVVFLALSLLPIAAAPTWPALALAIFVAGAANAGMEVSINAAADASERAHGHRIMSRCHGFWSLGIMAGALVAGAFAQAGVSYAIHLPIVAAAGLAFAALVRGIMPPVVFKSVARATGEGREPLFALPDRSVLGACAMAVGITLAEGAIYDWGTLYLRETLLASPFMAGVGYACFALAMAAGRFGGDAVRARFEAPAIVRACAIATAVGLVGLVFAPSVAAACLALALMGAGISLVFPIAVTAVAARSGSSSAANLAGLTSAVMASLLTAPPMIGIIGHAFGLGIALLCTLPFVVATGLLASQARSEPRSDLVAASGPA